MSVLDAVVLPPADLPEEGDADLVMQLMTPVLAASREALTARGAEILEFGEAAITAVFGARDPSELHAVQACRAALALREAVRAASGGRASLRAAIDSGETIATLSDAGLAASGPVLRRARRLVHALPGPVLALTPRAAEAAEGYAVLGPETPQGAELRGMARTVSRWRLRARRGLTAFVRREPEMAALRKALSEAAAGRGRAVLALGEPGVGKSRLAREFLAEAAAAGASTAECGALDFDRSAPLALVRKLLRALFDLDRLDDPEAAAAAVNAALSALGAETLRAPLRFALDLPAADAAWDLVPAPERLRQVREALRMLVALRARAGPLTLLVEDLHWADDESLAALERLAEAADRMPLVLLLTARPEFRAPWSRREAVKLLRLDLLGIADAEALRALPEGRERDSRQIDVLTRMQIAYVAAGACDTAIARTEAACALAERLGDRDRLADARLKLAYTLGTFGRVARALEEAGRLRRLAEAEGRERHLREADMAAALAHLMAGDAREALAQLAPHGEAYGGAWRLERFGLLITRGVWHRGSLAHAEAMLGNLRTARGLADAALATAAETARPQDRHAAVQFALQVEIAAGPSEAMLAEVAELVATTLDETLFPAGPWLLCSLGDAQLAAGRWAEAAATLERAEGAAWAASMPVIARNAAALRACAAAWAGEAGAAAVLRALLEGGDRPAWLRTRLLRALAATPQGRADAPALLAHAAELAAAKGLDPDRARALAALGETDSAARAAAERLSAEMRGR